MRESSEYQTYIWKACSRVPDFRSFSLLEALKGNTGPIKPLLFKGVLFAKIWKRQKDKIKISLKILDLNGTPINSKVSLYGFKHFIVLWHTFFAT